MERKNKRLTSTHENVNLFTFYSTNTMKSTELSLQEKLRNGDEQAFEWLYNEYKEGFLSFGKNYAFDQDELLDIYQDAVIALFQNFVQKQLILEQSTVKTYLFGIGKNLLNKAAQKKGKLVRMEGQVLSTEAIETEDIDTSTRSRQLAEAFRQLGAKCKEVLELFYYRGYSIKEIVEATDYKDENTVKSHKSRCMKGLREKIKSV